MNKNKAIFNNNLKRKEALNTPQPSISKKKRKEINSFNEILGRIRREMKATNKI